MKRAVTWKVSTFGSLKSTISRRCKESVASVSNTIERTFVLPERFKGTIVERWADYWKGLCRDYGEVFSGVAHSMRTQRAKTWAYLSGVAALGYCVQTNPDAAHFRDSLLSWRHKTLLVSELIRNPRAAHHLNYIESCCNLETLRRANFGLFCVIWESEYPDNMGAYKANCSYLQPKYLSYFDKVIDVGFLGKWWILEKKMEDYDINPEEWEKS